MSTSTPPNSSIDQLRSAVQSSGLTQTELADAAGVTQPVISRLFVPGRRMKTETADAIAAGLGMKFELVKK